MNSLTKSILSVLIFCLLLGTIGCSKKTGSKGVDTSKPISEIKAEVETMAVEQLKATAMKYKESITAKTAELEPLMTKLKEIPIAEQMGNEAKVIKDEIDTINKSIQTLKERFDIYYNKLKEKGGDITSLEL